MVQYPPEDMYELYVPPSRRGMRDVCGGVNPALAIGLLVLLFYAWKMMMQEEMRTKVYRAPGYITAMLSSMVGSEAKVTEDVKEIVGEEKASKDFQVEEKSKEKATILTPERGEGKEEKNAETVKQFVDSKKRCMIMIFAPWCGHCHKALPAFGEAAKEDKETDYGVINFEEVNKSLFQEGGMIPVSHFPFIVLLERETMTAKLLDKAATKENIVELSKPAPKEDSKKEA